MTVSPLAEVVRNQRINQILEAIRVAVRNGQSITIGPKDVDYIRRSFTTALALGQRKLHEAARLFLTNFWSPPSYRMTFIVMGRTREGNGGQIVTREVDLTDRPDEVLSIPDTQLSDEYAPLCPVSGLKAVVIASYVRYEPSQPVDSNLLELYARVKTTTNLCYKITDLVMDIDHVSRRDKIYNEFSQIVTDMYGMKAVLTRDDQVQPFVDQIRRMKDFEIVDQKDYLGDRRKKSGYEAYKLTFKREKQLIELQIQSRRMIDHEKNSRTANHRTYKERQLTERRKLGKEYLHVYHALSQLFATPERNVCDIEYIELGYSKKGMDDEF